MATTGWAGPVPDWEITRYFLGPGVRVDYTVEEGMVAPGVSGLHTPGHTPGSMSYMVHVGDLVVLVAGDTVYGYEYLSETPILYHTDTLAWMRSLEQLREANIDILVPGHGGVVDGKVEARKLIDKNLEAARRMLDLALGALDPDEWATGDEVAARLAEATGYARSGRAYSILGPTTRALLHALAAMGEAEEAVQRGVIVWRRR
jgi:glyoxylase-like metal-dependent hydrolase (beta-lactamase superfamily II)